MERKSVSEYADRLPLCDQFLSLAVLAAFIVAVQQTYILVADNEERGVLGDPIGCFASGTGS